MTREQGVIGHFNALFIKDAELMNLEDPKEALREHADREHSFSSTTLAGRWIHAFHHSRKLLEEGLIDGVEAVNGFGFYPRAISWCRDLNITLLPIPMPTIRFQFISIQFARERKMCYRPMTLVLAKDKSLEGST